MACRRLRPMSHYVQLFSAAAASAIAWIAFLARARRRGETRWPALQDGHRESAWPDCVDPIGYRTGGDRNFLYPAGLHASFALVGIPLASTALILVIEMMPMGQERLSLMASINVAESSLRFIVLIPLILFGARVTEVLKAFVALRVMTFLYLLDLKTFRLLQPNAISYAILMWFLR
jgi:hypothetical protein